MLSRFFILAILALAALVSACASHPREIARSETATEFGLAYKARVVGVRPIFVAQETGFDEYEEAASAGGVALGSIVFASATFSAALTDVLASVLAAVSGEFESRYRADYCQIYVSVDDATLIRAVIDDTTGGGGEEMLEMLFDRKQDLRNDLNQVGNSTSPEADAIRAQIEDLNSIIDRKISENGATRETKATVLGIVSPCWDVERGSTVYLTKFADGIAVQPIR